MIYLTFNAIGALLQCRHFSMAIKYLPVLSYPTEALFNLKKRKKKKGGEKGKELTMYLLFWRLLNSNMILNC